MTFSGLLAFYIGAMIFVIASMDNPFSGADRVSSTAIPQRISGLLDQPLRAMLSRSDRQANTFVICARTMAANVTVVASL